MKSKEIQTTTNNKIRTFLSPINKYGNRSLSTSDSCPQIFIQREPQKTYIDFRRINRQKIEKTHLQIKLNDFNKKQRRDGKLIKCTINKNKQPEQKQQKYEDNCDLLKMVRNLKEKVMRLEIQNKILLEKQQQDSIKLIKQEQIIKNLQEALSLNRTKVSYSFGLYQNQEKRVNDQDFMKTHKSFRKQFQQKCLDLKINKMYQQNRKLKQDYYMIFQQNKKLKMFNDFDTKDSSIASCNNDNKQLINFKMLQRALSQIQTKKLKQLQQIDILLFGAGI